MRKFGLIGYPLTHSFSKKYFTEKFSRERITDAAFELYELPAIEELPALLAANPELKGLSVTIPHKQAIIPYLHQLDPVAEQIGAVNALKISDGKLTGFNTDYIGFGEALREFYPVTQGGAALILGTGGASKAVQATLKNATIPYQVVSRNPVEGQISYADLTPEIMANVNLIVNATPLGTFPAVATAPAIPYEYLTPQHYLFDLVYNPEETLFMKNGREKGAKTANGYQMLVLQAEAAWKIWNS